MKKRLALVLALVLLTLTPLAALAQVAATSTYTNLVVGSTTPLSGNFFSEMFGNNTSDTDARMLLHGYNLMEWSSATGAYGINPSVVSGLIVTDDAQGNRTYTVSIYSDLYYSDGTRITARDYVFSMLLSIAPELRQIGGQTVDLDYISGCDSYKRGYSAVLSGVRLLNDLMFSMTVKAEYQPFFYELALLNYYPYPIHVIAPGCTVTDGGTGVSIQNSSGQGARIFTSQLLQSTLLDPATGYLSHPSVVSGPYTLQSYDNATGTAVFAINPYFKGDSAGSRPTIPQLTMCTVTPDNMIAKLQNGEVHLLNKCVSADAITQGRQLASDGSITAANYPRSGFSFISFSCERITVSSQAVRQAIAHCLDKDNLTAAYVSNYGLRVDGYYGIGQWIYEVANGTVEPPASTDGKDHQAEWDAITLDNLHVYGLDVNEAVRLLDAEGFNLNRSGSAFVPGVDDVRCKMLQGSLVALDLKLLYPEGNSIGDLLSTYFVPTLAQAGIRLTVEARPMSELLAIYYRNTERPCDMIYLGTNFSTVFDPSASLNPTDAISGVANHTGIADETLYRLAVDMRKTEPGDVLSYCQKWVKFQERWSEVLPAIPVYSNVYFDFYVPTLQNYRINSTQSWAQAILGAFWSDAPQTTPAPVDDEPIFEG